MTYIHTVCIELFWVMCLTYLVTQHWPNERNTSNQVSFWYELSSKISLEQCLVALAKSDKRPIQVLASDGKPIQLAICLSLLLTLVFSCSDNWWCFLGSGLSKLFVVLIFMAADLSMKTVKFCTMWKFPAACTVINSLLIKTLKLGYFGLEWHKLPSTMHLSKMLEVLGDGLP